jgi:hypothetical protein
MFPVHMCWLPDPAYYLQNITEEGQKMGRPVEKFATVRLQFFLVLSNLIFSCKMQSCTVVLYIFLASLKLNLTNF